jgi:acetyltransferase-like isoleucine patch superfamily enzyme
VGRNFRVIGWLDVKGPGQVVLGDNVVVDRTVTAWTYADDAVLSVGDDSYLNGTRFGCRSRITIGSRAILGDANIFDTDFHSTAANRWDKNASVRVRPITIANNVWVGSEAGILPGTSVGENSVVGFGAVCSGPFEANVIIAGNPARAVKNIPDAS